jgi:hypothetical protein
MRKTKPIPKLTPKQIEYFWSKVDRHGPKDCWEWQRGRGSSKYGMIWFSPSGMFLVHRIAYALGNGCTPGQLLVCHRCDNTRCCNPAHLFLGTCADNMADMRAKGRGAVGEANSRAKLTASIVQAILDSDELQRTLADRYGIAQTTVSQIRLGKTWKHVGDRTHIIRGPRRGNRCPHAKLTEDRVRRIRQSNQSNVALAKKYGVSPSTINLVRNGYTWATVA